ncbi:NADH dehydrogenase [Endozoicomonas montiporae]|uniref:NADH dehydrogenase n=2 Tax=Endozoicomonas montiporae TaxID=1027273 RepID=A0A081N0K9_9GAMM|nr:NAD(P)H-binding protein [Endozoicomonas montiporae]AMO54446.1 NADH dehydrogenase [Endozoicomonas montiporae CL-33]KEQ11982.1 NADH dehydrogenase [Endozoicomonas montiporae]
MAKTAVVVGATGLVGEELVKQLIRSDGFDKVVTVTRRSLDIESDKHQNHIINFEQLDQHADLIKGDMLFSCLGTTRKQAGSIAAQRRIDYDYQLQIAQLAAKNNVSHYLLVSSSGANAKSSAAYMKMKGELEEQVKQLPFKRVSIFQPSLLTGKRKETRTGEGIAAYIMPVLCKLTFLRKYRPITGKQVASKMLEVSLSKGKTLEYFVLDDVFPKTP